MNVGLETIQGLNIYKELLGRESKCAAQWNIDFGPEQQLKGPPPSKLKTREYEARGSHARDPLAGTCALRSPEFKRRSTCLRRVNGFACVCLGSRWPAAVRCTAVASLDASLRAAEGEEAARDGGKGV